MKRESLRARDFSRFRRQAHHGLHVCLLFLAVLTLCMLPSDALPLEPPKNGPAALLSLHAPLSGASSLARPDDSSTFDLQVDDKKQTDNDESDSHLPGRVSVGHRVPESATSREKECPKFDKFVCDYAKCVYYCNFPQVECSVVGCQEDCQWYFDRYCSE